MLQPARAKGLEGELSVVSPGEFDTKTGLKSWGFDINYGELEGFSVLWFFSRQ